MDDLHLRARPNTMTRRRELEEVVDASLEAIVGSEVIPVPLASVADQLRDEGTTLGGSGWGLAEALVALGHAVEWEPALAAADGNPLRYRDAARHIAAKALEHDRLGTWPTPLVEALQRLAELDSFGEVPEAAEQLRRVPLVFSITSVLEPRQPWTPPQPEAPRRPTPVVLLRFSLDGEPVSWPMALHAGRAYQLNVAVDTPDWPDDAELMTVEFATDAPSVVVEAPAITVRRDASTGSGYLIPHAEIGPNRTIELIPTAEFMTPDGALNAQIVGHRSLRIATFDPGTIGSGQPMVGQRILELLADLDSRIPNLPPQDRRDLIHLLDATSRFSALANERPELLGINERGFQAILKQAFAQDSMIGRRIQEAPKLGGGTTDLILGRVVDELKVSHTPIDIDRADQYVRQPTQYASGGDCPISMVTILDDSPKSEPPGVQSNLMRWALPAIYGAANPAVPSMVVVVIIPVGFPRPSDWSRGTGSTDRGT